MGSDASCRVRSPRAAWNPNGWDLGPGRPWRTGDMGRVPCHQPLRPPVPCDHSVFPGIGHRVSVPRNWQVWQEVGLEQGGASQGMARCGQRMCPVIFARVWDLGEQPWERNAPYLRPPHPHPATSSNCRFWFRCPGCIWQVPVGVLCGGLWAACSGAVGASDPRWVVTGWEAPAWLVTSPFLLSQEVQQ